MWGAPPEGVVVTHYDYATPCRSLPVLEAAHPVSDEAGGRASAAVFAAVEGLCADDLVAALVCGGGSALLPAPPEGVTLADEQALTKALLASGAPIGVMNAIRKHVSRIKGGRLVAASAPARVASLVVSVVPGDDPAQVASGPTVSDLVTEAVAFVMIEAPNIVFSRGLWRIFQVRGLLRRIPGMPVLPITRCGLWPRPVTAARGGP